MMCSEQVQDRFLGQFASNKNSESIVLTLVNIDTKHGTSSVISNKNHIADTLL